MKTKNKFCWIVLGVIIGIIFCFPIYAETQSQIEILVAQLNGGPHLYESYGMVRMNKGQVFVPECHKRKSSMLDFLGLSGRHSKEESILHAANCLASYKGNGEQELIVSELIKSLGNTKDYDTGDGIIPVRSGIIKVLGYLGDKAAIDPIKQILVSGDTTEVLKTASGVEPKADAYQHACLEALKMLGVTVQESDE